MRCSIVFALAVALVACEEPRPSSSQLSINLGSLRAALAASGSSPAIDSVVLEVTTTCTGLGAQVVDVPISLAPFDSAVADASNATPGGDVSFALPACGTAALGFVVFALEGGNSVAALKGAQTVELVPGEVDVTIDLYRVGELQVSLADASAPACTLTAADPSDGVTLAGLPLTFASPAQATLPVGDYTLSCVQAGGATVSASATIATATLTQVTLPTGASGTTGVTGATAPTFTLMVAADATSVVFSWTLSEPASMTVVVSLNAQVVATDVIPAGMTSDTVTGLLAGATYSYSLTASVVGVASAPLTGTFMTIPPLTIASSNIAQGAALPTNAASFDLQITFSEPVTNLSSSDVLLLPSLLGGTGNIVAGAPTMGSDSSQWTVTVGGLTPGASVIVLFSNTISTVAAPLRSLSGRSSFTLRVNSSGGPIHFVSAARGNDVNDGLRPTTALATLPPLFSTLGSGGAAGDTVLVEVGDYPVATPPLDYGLGGFTTWGSYLSDGEFDDFGRYNNFATTPANATPTSRFSYIHGNPAAGSGSTIPLLNMSNSDMSGPARMDGFYVAVDTPQASSAPVFAVAIGALATSPMLSNSLVFSGVNSAGNMTAVSVQFNCVLANNLIAGGCPSSANAFVTTGVDVQNSGGNATLISNTIVATCGTTLGSFAVATELSSGAYLIDNLLIASGVNAVGMHSAQIGMYGDPDLLQSNGFVIEPSVSHAFMDQIGNYHDVGANGSTGIDDYDGPELAFDGNIVVTLASALSILANAAGADGSLGTLYDDDWRLSGATGLTTNRPPNGNGCSQSDTAPCGGLSVDFAGFPWSAPATIGAYQALAGPSGLP